jgi:hypothetical protein
MEDDGRREGLENLDVQRLQESSSDIPGVLTLSVTDRWSAAGSSWAEVEPRGRGESPRLKFDC